MRSLAVALVALLVPALFVPGPGGPVRAETQAAVERVVAELGGPLRASAER